MKIRLAVPHKIRLEVDFTG